MLSSMADLMKKVHIGLLFLVLTDLIYGHPYVTYGYEILPPPTQIKGENFCAKLFAFSLGSY